MLKLSKLLILMLVAFGLLWNFYSASGKAFSAMKSEAVSEEVAEKENNEGNSEELKFLNHGEEFVAGTKIQRQLISTNSSNLVQFFPEVLTSPPNA